MLTCARIGLVKITARHRILAYIQRHPGASAGHIAAGLTMNVPAVRHHLEILESDGRIKPVGQSRLSRRGRLVRYRGSEGAIPPDRKRSRGPLSGPSQRIRGV